jgi:hypothetical protein
MHTHALVHKHAMHMHVPLSTLAGLVLTEIPDRGYSRYTMPCGAALARVFRTFRVLGLRHIVVVDDEGGAVGMITRKELTVHRMHELTHQFDQDFAGDAAATEAGGGSGGGAAATGGDPTLGLHSRRPTVGGSSDV